MKLTKYILLLFIFGITHFATAQDESEDYVEFNDRNNVVHGVYVGLNFGYGEIDSQSTYLSGLKIAYVANQQFEIGFSGNFLYSEQGIYRSAFEPKQDLIGAYGGLHLEPILFSKSVVNLSFPLLIGAGAMGYVNRSEIEQNEDVMLDEDNSAILFILEPGVSVLFNINRFLQLEAGIKYRFSNKIELFESPVDRVNGFSGGLGIKVGIFNMGRNRYKKKI